MNSVKSDCSNFEPLTDNNFIFNLILFLFYFILILFYFCEHII